MKQQCLASPSVFEKYGRKSRRELFLDEMEQVVPWSGLEALVRPHYAKAGRGRQPVGLSIMLRVYFVQPWFNLSDLPLDFARPLSGYEDVLYETFGQDSNYNSMQTTVQRSSQRLTYGPTWTWSKSMDEEDGEQDPVNPFINPRIRNYGESGSDRTHNVSINYDYNLPGFKNERILNSIIGNWETSGILAFLSGTPTGVSFGEVNVSNITYGGGAGVDSRVDVIGNPNLGKGQRTFSRAFNTVDIVMPNPITDPYGIGDANKDVFRGPGIENTDLALFKNIPWGDKVTRTMQFRIEAYNALNHTQFNSVKTSALFNPTIGAQTNTAFGSYNGAQNPRRLQLGFKISFWT
jgi:hypothetical protein